MATSKYVCWIVGSYIQRSSDPYQPVTSGTAIFPLQPSGPLVRSWGASASLATIAVTLGAIETTSLRHCGISVSSRRGVPIRQRLRACLRRSTVVRGASPARWSLLKGEHLGAFRLMN